MPYKNAVCALINHSNFHLAYNFSSIHSRAKKLYPHKFDIVDTALSYGRELIVCSFLQDFSTGKQSNLQLMCNAHTAFLLFGADWKQLEILMIFRRFKRNMIIYMICTNLVVYLHRPVFSKVD